MTYKVYHFRLPATQFVVSSTVFGHGYVFMRVSRWWRAVSVHCVYAAGKCHPSLARAFTQVPEHSLVQSSRLTFFSVMTGSSGKGLQIIFPWKIHSHFLQHISKRRKKIALIVTTRKSLLALLLRSLGHRNVLVLEKKVCLFYHERTLNCIELFSSQSQDVFPKSGLSC